MADTTAPILQRTLPADNATGVSVTSNLGLGFSEAVRAGSGLIKIYTSGGTLFHTIAANDTSQVTIDGTGTRVMIDPSVTLLGGTGYYVIIESGAFEDFAGNDYAGLSSPAAFNFTTAGSSGNVPADIAAPLLTGTSPADNATNVAPNANLTLTFNEAVKAGSGYIQIRESGSGGLVRQIAITDASQVSISGNQVTVNALADLSPWTNYFVMVGSGAILDLADNPFAGFSSSAVFNFSTNSVYVDTTAPIVLFTTPRDDIAGGANIIVTFNEPVKAGTGTIEIHKSSDGSVYRTISVTDWSQVAFFDRNLVIKPATDLDSGDTYYVVIAPEAIVDLDGNAYDGSSSIAAFVENTGVATATGLGSSGYAASAVASAFASAIAVSQWATTAVGVTATAYGPAGTSGAGDFIAGNDTALNLTSLNYSAALNGELTLISNDRIEVLGTDGRTYRIFGSDFNFSATTVAEAGGTGIWLIEVWAGAGGDAHIVHSHYNDFGSLSSTGSFDVTTGLAGDDTVIGSSDDDTLLGFDGADVIIGRDGDDNLDGGNGDDVLSGGLGADSLTGGVGADTYKFASGAHLAGDLVSGLESADKIDLSAIAGLTFIGSNGFSGIAGQTRYSWGGGNTTLQLDADGNGSTDASLLLSGAQFILGETTPGSNVLVVTGIAPSGLTLTGNGLNNTLTGGNGGDVITGLGRGDTLTGGGGSDRFVYTAVAESTGRLYDTITDFNASADVIDLWFQVTGVDAAISSGSLSARRIDADLATAVGASKLGAHHAVLFTPASGALAGNTFLIVDANNVAGYQANADLVILLGSASSLGGLTAADFV
jgi:Ca2+-binding RTX toxin-like protein